MKLKTAIKSTTRYLLWGALFVSVSLFILILSVALIQSLGQTTDVKPLECTDEIGNLIESVGSEKENLTDSCGKPDDRTFEGKLTIYRYSVKTEEFELQRFIEYVLIDNQVIGAGVNVIMEDVFEHNDMAAKDIKERASKIYERTSKKIGNISWEESQKLENSSDSQETWKKKRVWRNPQTESAKRSRSLEAVAMYEEVLKIGKSRKGESYNAESFHPKILYIFRDYSLK